MKINRLFGIVYLLMNRGTLTAKELAAHFEVSVRTILRDIDTLAAAGMPVYTKQGKGGGVALMDNFVLNKAALSKEEQSELILALQSVSASGYIGTDAVISKLGNLFQNSGQSWLEVDFSRWGQTSEEQERFELLKTATLQHRAVQMEYAGSYGDISERKVYPVKMRFKNKAWYLHAYCTLRGDYRMFKLGRIIEAELLDEQFEPDVFSADEMEVTSLPPTGIICLKLRFKRSAAHRVYEEFYPQDILKAEDALLVTAHYPHDHWLYSFLLSFGDEVQVLEPEMVRAQLLLEVEKIKSLYQ